LVQAIARRAVGSARGCASVIAVARGLLFTLLSIHPRSVRIQAARARRVRPVLPSRATELRYRFALNQVVEQCRRAGEDIASGMRAHWPFPAAADALPVADAPPPPPGAPLPAHGLSTLLDQAARRLSGLEHQAETMARLAAARVRADVDEKLAENLVRSVGVDITSYLVPDEEIGAAMRAAIADNVALIKSIPAEYLDKVKAAVEHSWVTGQRFESLALRIKEIGDITERRAAFIARDQTSKMNAAFNEVRQTSVGIQEYDWSTSRDERVRPSHQVMNGTRQRWSAPPLVDGEHVHPGEAIRCRCAAIPRINFSELAPEGETQREAA
jgi:SPP1 gp7 family putative phage head morphogenesis protein